MDGEGCFHISLRKKSRGQAGYASELSFSIGLNKKDIELLKLIEAYFGGIGVLSVNKKMALWRVRSIEDLKVIVGHFDRYPLITKKRIDYILFKAAMQLIINEEHLTEEGLREMASLRATINKGLSKTLKQAFPDVKPIELPSSVTEFTTQPETINPYWATGFTEGEGCFFVIIHENKAKGYFAVRIGYQLTQHIRDFLLIKSLKYFFKCGRTEPSRKAAISFRVTKTNDNLEKIVPFFEKYPLLGSKSKDFKDWVEVSKLIASKAHLTPEGLNKIKKIKSGMNSSIKFPEE